MQHPIYNQEADLICQISRLEGELDQAKEDLKHIQDTIEESMCTGCDEIQLNNLNDAGYCFECVAEIGVR